MQNGVKTVVKKVKYILFPCEHFVIILFSSSEEKLFQGFAVCGNGNGKVCNYGRKNGSTHQGEFVIDCPSKVVYKKLRFEHECALYFPMNDHYFR